jgi:hypothetical protein
VLVDNRLDLQPAVSPRPAPAQDDRHPRSPAPPSSQGRPWSGCPQHSTGAHRRAKSAGTWPVARRVQEQGKSGSVPPQNAVVSGRAQEIRENRKRQNPGVGPCSWKPAQDVPATTESRCRAVFRKQRNQGEAESRCRAVFRKSGKIGRAECTRPNRRQWCRAVFRETGQ